MLRLETFGGLRLRRDDGSAAMTQRRRLALLALLAGGGDHALARERIAAYLWPDASLDNTRRSLDQLVYEIRHSVGETALLGANPLQLNPAVIEADVVLFEQALSAGSLETAVALYRGPFLDGFFLPNAPDFERWAESVRARLAERFGLALERLASDAEARGDYAGAIAWWRQLAAHDPVRAPGALGLMRALAASGDRGGALAYARVYERLVMQELESAPDPLIVKLAGELRQGLDCVDVADTRRPPVRDETVAEVGEIAVDSMSSPRAVTPSGMDRPSRRARPLVLAALLLGVALAVGSLWSRWIRVGSAATGQPTMLVTPFRIVGTDSSLREFGEGMVDLLAPEFTGEGSPLAVDARTAINAWSRIATANRQSTVEDARQVARDAGAEWVLVGDLVKLPGGDVRLGGRLVRASDGSQQIVPSVTAPRDSLATAINSFAGNVLTHVAGLAESRAGTPMTASLPALRAYLAGRAEHRRAQGTAAVASFARALEFDSTFALAALDLVSATGWLLRWGVVTPFDTGRRIASLLPGSNPSRAATDDARFDRAMRIAWNERAKLSGRDRALLLAIHGERYPEPSYAREVLVSLERATRIPPDRAETHYAIGHLLLHQGAAIGISDPRERASASFRKALALDSSYAAPLAGLLEVAAFDEDTASLRTLRALYLARDSVSPAADYVRWRVAVGTGDERALRALRARFGTLSVETLERIQVTSQVAGVALEDADRAMDVIVERAGDSYQRWIALFNASILALNRGRPREARRFLQLKRELERNDVSLWHNSCLDDAFGDGDTEAAAAAISGLRQQSARRPEPPSWNATLCLLTHGDTAGSGSTIDKLRAAADDRADILAALRAGVTRLSDASLLGRVDSLALRGCCGGPKWIGLASATLHERAGDDAGALRALRAGRWVFPPQYLSTYLREEGRLAARVGDREGAIRAYRHYLALRSNPEPLLRADADRIRGELARLERGESAQNE